MPNSLPALVFVSSDHQLNDLALTSPINTRKKVDNASTFDKIKFKYLKSKFSNVDPKFVCSLAWRSVTNSKKDSILPILILVTIHPYIGHHMY